MRGNLLAGGGAAARRRRRIRFFGAQVNPVASPSARPPGEFVRQLKDQGQRVPPLSPSFRPYLMKSCAYMEDRRLNGGSGMYDLSLVISGCAKPVSVSQDSSTLGWNPGKLRVLRVMEYRRSENLSRRRRPRSID